MSDFALAGTVLTRDLVAADGKLVASRGEIVDLAYLKEVAARAPRDLSDPAWQQTTSDKALAETAALLVLSKQLEAIFQRSEEE